MCSLMIKIVLWLIFFFCWLYGKVVRNNINTTFLDWFLVLYYIYLFFVVVLPDNIQVQKFNFIDYTICFFLIISIYKDFFCGLKYFIIQFKGGDYFIERIDKVKKYLFEEKVEDVSEFLLAIVLIGLMCIQINYATPTINLVDKSNMELLGFIVSIFSMYGIYIGFLQYLAGDIKADTYLGRSKVNYLIQKSLWYYLTQSKLFVMMLLTTVIVPIVVKLNINFIKELTILWQTSYLLLLGIYIFLLRMSLYIIRVVLLMKSKDDENLKYNMKKQIQQDYTEIFWLVYNNIDRYENDFIKKFLTRDFAKLEEQEYEEFIKNIFYINNLDDRNLYRSILNKIEKGFKLTKTQNFCNKFFHNKDQYDLEHMWKFYNYFKKFIFDKWSFLKDYQDTFSSETWGYLIRRDLSIIKKIKKIIEKDLTLASLKIECPDERQALDRSLYRNENVREFLFNLLIEKDGINLNRVLKDIQDEIQEEIQKFKVEKSDVFYRDTYDFLKFRLLVILDKYENGNFNLNLPEFQRLSDNKAFHNGERNDYENSMFYSKICFNYLSTRGRIEKFSQNKIEKTDNEKQGKNKTKAQKMKDLILSLNEEYRLAFMLYQLLYTDRIQWDDNLEFYDAEIRKIMNYGKVYHDYLFAQVKKIIVSETDITHRITEKFLDKLWETRHAKINDFSWFDQFDEGHLMSDLKIFYIQDLLSGKEYPCNRFDIKNIINKNKRIENFCREYLKLTDKLTNIFLKELYDPEKSNVQTSIEYIFHCCKVNLSDIIKNISASGLLRLECILSNKCSHYNYTSRTFFDAQISSDYWSGGSGILEFYIIKIIDDFYCDVIQNIDFLKCFKYQLDYQLNSLNKTVDEYVESIVEKVSGIENISILKKRQIISSLNAILKPG